MIPALLTLGPAAFFAGMGLVALADPQRILRYFGVPALEVDGKNEVRAVYGGFGLAVAGLLVAALRLPRIREGVLVAIAVSVFGMAIGRLIAAAIDRRFGAYPRLFFLVELVLGGALAGALWLG